MTVESALVIRPGVIGTTVNAVDLRAVYKWLEVLTPFKDWSKRKLEDFELSKDYIVSCSDLEHAQICASSNTSKLAVNYLVTLDTAKHICMLERNQKGKEARDYFIACEQRALAPARRKANVRLAGFYTLEEYLTVKGIEFSGYELTRIGAELIKSWRQRGNKPATVTLVTGVKVATFPEALIQEIACNFYHICNRDNCRKLIASKACE